MDFSVIMDRATRALRSDPTAFTDAGQDESHTGSAALLVAIIGVVSGLLQGVFNPQMGVGGGLFGGLFGAFIGWFIGTGIMYGLAKLFGGDGEFMGLLRGNAYAAVPTVISGIPIIGLVGLYSIWLYILNVRENMNLSTGAAVAVVLIPLVIVFVLIILLAVVIGVALLGAS